MTGPDPEWRELQRQRQAERQALAEAHAALPDCIAPGCEDKGSYVFVAAENGRLGGQDWTRGAEIRLCPPHASDIYRSQGVYGLDELPEWLRPDAKLDPLDAYDAEADSLYGAEIDRARRRIPQLRHEQRP
jgi:hypothetical protein